MLSSTTLQNGVLTLAGNSGSSNVMTAQLSNDGSSILTVVDGSIQSFPTSDVSSIQVIGGNESDVILLASSISAPETITAGTGSAFISTGTQAIVENANSSDIIVGATAATALSGNSGSSTSGSSTSTSSSGSAASSSGASSPSSGATSVSSPTSGPSTSGSSSSSTPSTGDTSSGSSSTSSNSGSSTSSTPSSTGSSSTGTGSSTGASSSNGSSSSTSSSSTGGSSSTGSSTTTTSTGSTSGTGSGANSTNTGGSTSGSSTTTSGTGSSTSGDSSGGSTDTNTGSNSGSSSLPGAPSPVITVTAGQTILPGQSVHVQALASDFGSGSSTTDDITWNFGDPSGTYNTLTGFNAAHVYNTPGTYTVTLTLTTPSGQSNSTTTQVTVQPDTRQTIYVSPDGSDSNSGLSPSSPIQSIAQVNAMLTSNTIVEFEDGGTYDTSTALQVNGLSNVEITSYGSGAQPVIMYNGPESTNTEMIAVLPGSSGVTIRGLTFDSIYTNPLDDNSIASAIFLNGDNITVQDNTFLNCWYDVDCAPGPSDVLIQDNSSPSTTGLREYFVWASGNDIAIVGNTVANSTRQSLIRCDNVNDLLIANNNLANIAGPGGPEDGVKGSVVVQYGTYAYVADNTVTSGPMGVGPLDTDLPDALANSGATFQYCVFDGNIVDSEIDVIPGAIDTVARNNVITDNGGVAFDINAQNPDYPNRQVQNLQVYDNTVIDNDQLGGFLIIADGQAQNVSVDNNLFIAPNYQVGQGDGIIYVDENNLDSFSQIQNNIWPVPSVIQWAQGGYFYVNSGDGVQSGYLTPAQWEATGVASGDVYQNVTLGSTYQATVNGVTAGSPLSVS